MAQPLSRGVPHVALIPMPLVQAIARKPPQDRSHSALVLP